MNVLSETMKKDRPDGWWYPWIFVGAMLFVVFVNGIMVFIALNTWTGLETESHYRKGLVYNENLNAARAQEALGWEVTFDLTSTAGEGPVRHVDLVVQFNEGDGSPLDNLDVRVVFLRPTHEGYDREAIPAQTGNGRYSARTQLPLAGQWSVRIHAFRGDDVFQMERRVTIR